MLLRELKVCSIVKNKIRKFYFDNLYSINIGHFLLYISHEVRVEGEGVELSLDLHFSDPRDKLLEPITRCKKYTTHIHANIHKHTHTPTHTQTHPHTNTHKYNHTHTHTNQQT